MGYFAFLEGLPYTIIGLVFLGAFMTVCVSIAALRSHRATSVAVSSFQELRRRAYDTKLAELEGEDAARRKHATFNVFSTTSVVQQIAEENEARRKGRLRRIERGEE